MEQPTLNDIYLAVGEIKGEVKGINQRLDRQNGSIGKLTDRTNTLESFCDGMKGKIVAGAVITSGAVAIVGLLLQYYYR